MTLICDLTLYQEDPLRFDDQSLFWSTGNLIFSSRNLYCFKFSRWTARYQEAIIRNAAVWQKDLMINSHMVEAQQNINRQISFTWKQDDQLKLYVFIYFSYIMWLYLIIVRTHVLLRPPEGTLSRLLTEPDLLPYPISHHAPATASSSPVVLIQSMVVPHSC